MNLCGRELEGQLQALMLDGRIGREDAVNRLMELNLDRALRIARRYAANNHGLREELEGAAIDGLIRAAELFDPNRGVRFWTYAERKVRSCIRGCFRKRLAVPIGLLIDDGLAYPYDELPTFNDEQVRRLAARMLYEVGIRPHPAAVSALFGDMTKREAARAIGMNYDVFRRRLKLIYRTKTAIRFLKYVETN